MADQECLTLSVPEAAQLLGVSRALAYQLVARGELPSLRLGKRLVIPRHVIDALLSSCTGVGATGVASPTSPDWELADGGGESARHDANSNGHAQDQDPHIEPPSAPTKGSPRPSRGPATRAQPISRTQIASPAHTLAPGVRGRPNGRPGGR
jgi:excisionase family DNA binding protein